MAASTITRTTWTNDTGTPTTPVGDGTLLNNARLQDIYAAIDQLFSGAGSYTTLTVGGLIKVEGAGASEFTASLTGGQILRVRNSSSNASAYAEINVGNNTSQSLGRLAVGSSASGFGDPVPADGMGVTSSGAGGVVIAATHASGTVRIMSGNAARAQWGASGHFAHGTTAGTSAFLIGGTAWTSHGLHNAITSSPAAGQDVYGLFNNPTLNIASSGAHGVMAGAFFNTPTINSGSGSATLTATVYIAGAPTAGASNYALYVPSGAVLLNGAVVLKAGSVSAPSLCRAAVGGTTGIYFGSSDTQVRVAVNGEEGAWFGGSSGAAKWLEVPSAANGSTVSGNYIKIGRNSTGGGAAGTLNFVRADGSNRYLYADGAGDLRIHTAQPTEGTTDTTIGTVVGTQTSTRATKRDIAPFLDVDGALALIRRTPLFRFRYRDGDDTEHVGIMAEDSPAFTRYGGTVFNPISAFGYSAAAIQALAARLERLESRA